MKTTLLVVAWNEIDGMKQIMLRVKKEWCDQIIILDGGSTDGSIEWAREQGYFVYVQKEPGVRFGYNEVLPYIQGDVVLTFSPDGNSVPELIPDLFRKMESGCDMVIASRYLPPAKSEDDSWVTAFGNWIFTKTINCLHGGRYTDAFVIFRAYRKQIIYDLELEKDKWYATPERIFRTRISWEPLLSIRCAKRKLRVAEIPGDEPPRLGGVRKLQVLKWGAAYLFQVVRECFFWK